MSDSMRWTPSLLAVVAAMEALVTTSARPAPVLCAGHWAKVADEGPPGRFGNRLAYDSARQRETRGNQLLAQNRSLGHDHDLAAVAGEDAGLSPEEVAALLAALDARVSPEARTQLGKTALAMAGTLRGFESPPGRKVMLLLTGGWSVGVAPRLYGPLIGAANQLGYTLYPVDVANPTGRTLRALDGLAAQTGGKVANSVRQDVLRTVAADARLPGARHRDPVAGRGARARRPRADPRRHPGRDPG